MSFVGKYDFSNERERERERERKRERDKHDSFPN